MTELTPELIKGIMQANNIWEDDYHDIQFKEFFCLDLGTPIVKYKFSTVDNYGIVAIWIDGEQIKAQLI